MVTVNLKKVFLMASLKDISRDTGFDVSVVSRALSPDPAANARVSEEARRVIKESAVKLGFTPNRAAEFLKRGGSPAIGVFIPEYSNRLVADLVIGLSEAAGLRGFPLNLYFGITLESYDLFLHNAAAAAHSGIITYPFNTIMLKGESVASKLERYRVDKGSVLILNSNDPPASVPALSVDNHIGGRLAAQRLVSRRCQMFLVYGSFPGRNEGFLEVVADSGQKADVFDSLEKLGQQMKRLSRKKRAGPVGLFCVTDELALRAYALARDAGFTVGEDFLVVGYDDLNLTELVDPPLTTIQQPFRELGSRAIVKIVNMIYGKTEESERIAPRLVARASA